MEIKQNQRQVLLEELQTGFGNAGFSPEEANDLSKKVVTLLRPLDMEIRDIPEKFFDVKATIHALAAKQGRSPASVKGEVERDPSPLLRHHRLVKTEKPNADTTLPPDAPPATNKPKAEKPSKPKASIADWPDAATIFHRAAQHMLDHGTLPALICGKTPGQLSRAFRKGEIAGCEAFCQERPETLPAFLRACGLTQNNCHGFPVPVRKDDIMDIMDQHGFSKDSGLPRPRPQQIP